MNITLNGKKITNPIAQAFWGLFTLFVTWSVFAFVAIIIFIIFAFLLSPIWLPIWALIKIIH